MNQDIFKNSLAESVRYLRAYGEERLRELEEAWNSLDSESNAEPSREELEPVSESLMRKALSAQTITAKPVEAVTEVESPSPSFLQRLLGW